MCNNLIVTIFPLVSNMCGCIDIHPGNVALPLPPEADLEASITQPPRQDEIMRKDGEPTSPLLPRYVAEPISIGFSRGPAVLLDLGYAFLAQPGMSYRIRAFGDTVFGPPELYGTSEETTLPFKVDSWSLGRLVCVKEKPPNSCPTKEKF